MKKKIVMTLLIGSLAAVTPAICFAAETVKAEESKTPLKTVGEEKEGCITFKLSNSTTKKITGLAIKASEKDEFPENMMEENDSFEVDEKKRIYFMEETEEPQETKLEESGEADSVPATEEEVNSNPEDPTAEDAEEELKKYDLHITFEDESTADVFDIALEDLTTVVIREKDGIVYATYKSLSTKEKINTYDAQKALADQAAAEEAAAQAAAQQAAVSQNTAQQTPSYDYTYDYDNAEDYTYDYSNEGDQNADSGESGSEEVGETVGDATGGETGGETTGETAGGEAGGETTGDTNGSEAGGETTGDTNGSEAGGETTGDTNGSEAGGETTGDTNGSEAGGETAGDTTGSETDGGDGCLNNGLLN